MAANSHSLPNTTSKQAGPIILAVCNSKGGSNKTTASVNIAGELARRGLRVLLVDLDPQGDATKTVRIPDMEWPGSTDQVLLGQQDLHEALLPTQLETLRLLPADRELLGIDKRLERERPEDYHQAVAQILKNATDFDYIILDCPGNLGPFTLMALTAAHAYLVPCVTQYYCIDGLKEITAVVENLEQIGIAPNLHFAGTFFSPYNPNKRSKLHKRIVNAAEELFPGKVLPYIREDQLIGLCQTDQLLLQVAEPESRGAQDFQTFTDALLVELQGLGA